MNVSEAHIEELLRLWHDGAWPDCGLEDLIREATGWTHHDYDRWVRTGSMPNQPIIRGPIGGP